MKQILPYFRPAIRFVAAAFLLWMSAAGVAAWAAPNPDLAKLIRDYDDFLLGRDPILAGRMGDRDAAGRWPDSSPERRVSETRRLEAFRTAVNELDPARLDAADRENRAFLSRSIGDALALDAFDTERLPFTADSGFNHTPDYVARSTVIRSADDANAWITRLKTIPEFYAREIANARRGLNTGFVQPDIVVEAALRAARAQAQTRAEQSSLLMPFEKLPANLTDAEQTRLRAEAFAIVKSEVKPAQDGFVRFLEREYKPHTRAGVGISSLEGGRAYYAQLVKSYTTTELDPDRVHEIGLAEVARIRDEMEMVKTRAGFRGSLSEFIAWLRRDKRFYAPDRQTLVEKVSTIAKRIDDQLPKYFATLPRLPYGVREVPREIEESYTSGRYWEGSPELGIAGGYMINTSHLDQRPLYEMPALSLHEAVPGHHIQIALSQENGALPLFRRQSDMTVFVEGWALYAERLGVEMGIYRDPYEHFGRLSFEMWRACRLVVDTGLHWKGWSREKARAYLADNTALGQKNVDVEIDRYIGWPGQALAYKIGELKIVELRAKAEKALGAGFNIRRFHDAVLGGGALPLDLLSDRIDQWIESERAK